MRLAEAMMANGRHADAVEQPQEALKIDEGHVPALKSVLVAVTSAIAK